MNDVSVVIPLGPGEETWKNLIADLILLPMDTEIIFVGADLDLAATKIISDRLGRGRPIRIIKEASGRAKQLNAGARAAKHPFLWFLHADSRFSATTIPSLEHALENFPEAILYSDLKFADPGTQPMVINEVCAWVRSHALGMPFGDQGLCVARWIFEKLGGFDERAEYGEDHLFVWKARRAGYKLHGTGGSLLTSARKYQKRGWGRTTALHQYLTFKQAIPEYIQLMRSRFSQTRATK